MTTLTATDTTARVWISSFGAYNAGFLIGRWVDAAEAADVTARQLFEGTPYRWTDDEELHCFDVEGMLVDREMSPAEATAQAELLESVAEHQRLAFRAWAASGNHVEGGDGLPSVSDFEERYCGEWSSFDDYARQHGDDMALLKDVPDDLVGYFDWAAWTRDLRFDYSVIEAASGVYVFRCY